MWFILNFFQFSQLTQPVLQYAKPVGVYLFSTEQLEIFDLKSNTKEILNLNKSL